MVRDHQGDHASQWRRFASIASKTCSTAESLRRGCGRLSRCGDAPRRDDDERERSKTLERETASFVRRTRFCAGVGYFAQAELDAGSSHDRLHRRSSRGARGRADLRGFAIAPSTYRAHARRARSRKGSGGRGRDMRFARENPARLRRHFQVLACARIWRQLLREGEAWRLHGRSG